MTNTYRDYASTTLTLESTVSSRHFLTLRPIAYCFTWNPDLLTWTPYVAPIGAHEAMEFAAFTVKYPLMEYAMRRTL